MFGPDHQHDFINSCAFDCTEIFMSNCRAIEKVTPKTVNLIQETTVGYMVEFVTGENFQGITFGLSIPLWESKGKVRSAKDAAQASLSAAEDARQQYRLQLKTLYDQAVTLQETVKQYDTLLHGTGETLLLKAFNAGELSLIHYIEQQEYYLDASHRHLDALHELATTMALLTAFSL